MSLLNIKTFRDLIDRSDLTASIEGLILEHDINNQQVTLHYNLVLTYSYYEVVAPCTSIIDLFKAKDRALDHADNNAYIKLLENAELTFSIRHDEKVAIYIKGKDKQTQTALIDLQPQVIDELGYLIEEPFEAFMAYEAVTFYGQEVNINRAVKSLLFRHSDTYHKLITEKAAAMLQGNTRQTIKCIKVITAN